jgi:HJR/Mrr/RecB family endonuclease
MDLGDIAPSEEFIKKAIFNHVLGKLSKQENDYQEILLRTLKDMGIDDRFAKDFPKFEQGRYVINKDVAHKMWLDILSPHLVLIDDPEIYMHPANWTMERGPVTPYGNNYEYTNKSSLLLPKEAIIGKDEYTELISMISRQPEFMKQLEPYKFEELIAELLKRMGFEVKHTKKTRDGGYDLLAIGHTPLGPHRIGVECKRYTENKVGVDMVRNIYAVKMLKNFNQAMIVTTSSFSKDAYLEIKNLKSEILLKDHRDIKEWCADYGVKGHYGNFRNQK